MSKKYTPQTMKNALDGILDAVEKETTARGYRAANKLRSASLFVLRGTRSGRYYIIPRTYENGGKRYRASAPGEAPANRTGKFRLSWGTHVRGVKVNRQYRVTSGIESSLRANDYLLGDLLEHGTTRMAPRPYKQAVIDRAMPEIIKIYKKPYRV